MGPKSHLQLNPCTISKDWSLWRTRADIHFMLSLLARWEINFCKGLFWVEKGYTWESLGSCRCKHRKQKQVAGRDAQ